MLKIETTIKYNWKLKAIDSIMTMMSADKKGLPLEECQKIIDNLIDNQEIKDILFQMGLELHGNVENE